MHTGIVKRTIIITVLVWLSLLYLAACCVQDKTAPSYPLSEPTPAYKEEDLMIAKICAESEHYVGSVITLQGLFQDWKVAECQFPEGAAKHPRTRGDWLMRTGDDCVYVTGGLPKDFDPSKSENLGRRIELEAEVMKDEDGKVYLAYRNSRRL